MQAAKELEECTFQPNVDLPDSLTRAAQAGLVQGPSVGTRLAPPCAPSHPRMPPHAPSPPPSSQAQHVATSAATSAWGAVAIDEHLARQRGARAMRDARDARCKLADGSGYTGRPT